MTPEHDLWLAVLQTIVTEAKTKCTNPTYRCKKHWKRGLKREVSSSWTEEICDMLGISYGKFKEYIYENCDKYCEVHER